MPFCTLLHPPLQRLSSYLLTTSDYGDSRPIRNGSNGTGLLLQRDKFCAAAAAPLEANDDGDPDAICVLAPLANLGRSGECAPA